MSEPHPCRAARGASNRRRLTAETHATIVEAILAGNYIEVAASLAGVSRQVVFQWIRRGVDRPNTEPYASFARDVKAARAKAEHRDVLALSVLAMQKKDLATAGRVLMWRLERRSPSRWGQRVHIELAQELGLLLDTARTTLGDDAYGKLIAALSAREGSPEDVER